MEDAAKNTDRELWREREGDYYSDSIFVTESGAIGMNVDGTVIVKPIREWFESVKTRKMPSADWMGQPQWQRYTVLDPDGWDRQNFTASWNELITEQEFEKRLMQSTILIKGKPNAT